MNQVANETINKMLDEMNKQPLQFASRPTKIVFEQLFPTGEFRNQRLSIEFNVGDEDPIEVFQTAKTLVQQAFQAINPGLDEMKGTTITPVTSFERHEEPIVRSREDVIAAHIITINECKTLRNLEMFANMVQRENDDRLYEAYSNKKKELQSLQK